MIRDVGDALDVGPEADVAGTETSASTLRQDDLKGGGRSGQGPSNIRPDQDFQLRIKFSETLNR